MKRKSIKFDELTHSRLMFIAKTLNMPLSHFLKELSQELFSVCSVFKSMNVFYDSYGNTLKIEFTGKSILVSGIMPMPDEISEKACDVAISTVVEKQFELREKGEKNA